MEITEADVFEEILLRLPVKSLTRCKSLSKYWYNFISSNTSFRQSYLSTLRGGSPLMLGFFAHRFFGDEQEVPVPEHIRFIPVCNQGRALKTGDNNTWKWKAPPLPHPFDESLSFLGLPQVFIAASSNGFLLCRLEEYYPISYYVCNPITKEWVALPKATVTSRRMPTAFLSNGNYPCLSKVNYKVVRAVWHSITGCINNLTLEIFSSEDFQWKVLHLTCPTPFHLDMIYAHTVINQQGSVHWIANTWTTVRHSDYYKNFARSVLVFDQRKDSLEIVAVPGDASGCDCLTLSCGYIFYTRLYPSSYKFEIWVLIENRECKKEIFLKYKGGFKKKIHKFPQSWAFGDYTVMGLHPFNPKLIFLSSKSHRMVACYNAEKSTVELICELPIPPYALTYKFVAYIWPNWPPFFP